MRALCLGGLIAALAACGSNVPAHPTCTQSSDCSGGDVCHLPPGGASGVCVVTCLSSSSCPSSEPWCVPDETSSAAPFSFCGCATQGADAGVSPGCGDNNGYGCSDTLQVCLPR
ncbi:MAG TPA: hypothetical protein VMB50_12580 [Myxococcales bacterium]|nr:hypothetical protein [Myxococcales bacterium]